MAKTRVNLYFDDEMLKRIDNEAKIMGVSRTAAISMMVSQYLQQKQVLEVGSGMLELVNNKSNLNAQTNIFDIINNNDISLK